MQENKPTFYAVIPADVRYSDIIPNAKLLYGEITALCGKEGFCWASNNYFANLYKKNVTTISEWINLLEKSDFISIESDGKNRKIFLMLREKPKYASGKTEGYASGKAEHNNTSINNINNNSEQSSQATKFSFDPIDLELATLLKDLIKNNTPSFKEPNLDSWAKEVRLMRERDQRTVEQIKYVINWSQKDNFWQANILSTKKLREKFDTLVAQIKRNVDKKKNISDSVAFH